MLGSLLPALLPSVISLTTTRGCNESCTDKSPLIAKLLPVDALTERIDAIVSGHTHSLVDTYVNGIPIVQARFSGQAVAVIDIPLSEEGKPSGEAVAEVRPVPVASTPAYAPVDSIVARAAARVAPIVRRRVASLAVPLDRDGSQYSLGNLIADLLLAIADPRISYD